MSWYVYLLIGYIIGAVIAYMFDLLIFFTIIYAAASACLEWIIHDIRENKKLQEDILNGRYTGE